MLTFNYSIRSSGDGQVRRDVLLVPGLIIAATKDQPVIMSGKPGWPSRADSGDPFIDFDGAAGFQIRADKSSDYQIQQVRTKKYLSRLQNKASLGTIQGYSSEFVGMEMTDVGTGTNDFGYQRPKWSLFNIVRDIPDVDGQPQTNPIPQNGYETTHVTDWPWSLGGTGEDGTDLRPQWMRVIQARYLPGAQYPWGACTTKGLAVLLRPAATVIEPDPDLPSPNGRHYLGFSIDSYGVKRRILDISPAAARRIGHDNGFVPPDVDVITSAGQTYEWQHIRVLGGYGDEAVFASGVLLYNEEYERIPTADERSYYMSGYPGEGSSRLSVPFGEDVDWYYSKSPVRITEKRSTFVFCEMVINANSIVQLNVTGRSTSASSSVLVDSLATYIAFKRRGGRVDAVWNDASFLGPVGYTNEGGSYSGEVIPGRPMLSPIVSPNGWRTPVFWPVYYDEMGMEHYLSPYMPIAMFPDVIGFNSIPPKKPDDWDDEEMGPWVEPPYDVDPGQFWLGQLYYDFDQRRIMHSQGPNNTFFSSANRGYAQARSVYANANGGARNYTQTGAYQMYGRGTWTLFRHYNADTGPFVATRNVAFIIPGTSGPGGTLPQTAGDDGGNCLSRWFPWPRQNTVFAKTQFGGWLYRYNGQYVNSPIDLGSPDGWGWLDGKLVGAKPPKAEPEDPPAT